MFNDQYLNILGRRQCKQDAWLSDIRTQRNSRFVLSIDALSISIFAVVTSNVEK